jgi:predicted transcriptional regulator
MKRGSFDVAEAIIKLLKKKGELSINSISRGVNARWDTTVNSLKFLSRVGLVIERQGKKTNKVERLFSLK